MTSTPNNLLIAPPAPQEIRASRLQAGLTQGQMANALDVASDKIISKWESATANDSNRRKPSPALWTAWLLLSDQHPNFSLTKKVD